MKVPTYKRAAEVCGSPNIGGPGRKVPKYRGGGEGHKGGPERKVSKYRTRQEGSQIYMDMQDRHNGSQI